VTNAIENDKKLKRLHFLIALNEGYNCVCALRMV